MSNIEKENNLKHVLLRKFKIEFSKLLTTSNEALRSKRDQFLSVMKDLSISGLADVGFDLSLDILFHFPFSSRSLLRLYDFSTLENFLDCSKLLRGLVFFSSFIRDVD